MISSKFLSQLAVIIITTVLNVIISMCVSFVFVLIAMEEKGWDRRLSLVIAILVAVAITSYLALLPRLRDYLKG